MLCFLCSFAKGRYCYCRPGRPAKVVSMLNMLIVDTTFHPNGVLRRRRARSVPVRQRNFSQLVRFRSLRGAKAEPLDCRCPIRVDVVSIPSSAESVYKRRKSRREQARRRLEMQLSSSSSTSPSMSSESQPQPQLLFERSSCDSSPDASCEESTSTEQLVIAEESINRSNFALLVRDMENDQAKNCEDEQAVDLEDSSVTQKKISPTVIDRLHLELIHLPDTPPNGCFGSVSYLADMEKFAQGHHVNAFVDPFEEENRRSRIEVWVESTSPGCLSDHEEVDAICAMPSDDCLDTAEVKVFKSSEKSTSTSPPCNTTTSTTGVDEELSTAVQIHNHDDVLRNEKKPRTVLNRENSLTTSEKSETNSFVSSDFDKASIIKLKFRSNLHRAREDAKREVDMSEFDRFWRYCYKKEDDSNVTSSNMERNRIRRRSHSPSIERVVMYYTTDRRPSATLSLFPPSTEPTPQCSHVSEASGHLYVPDTKRVATIQQGPITSEPFGDSVHAQGDFKMSSRMSDASNSDDIVGIGHFFRLSEMSESDLEEQRVAAEGDRADSENTASAVHQSTLLPIATTNPSKDKSTSTADLTSSSTNISYPEGRGLDNTYKSTMLDKSTVTSPILNDTEAHSSEEMQQQVAATDWSLPPSSPLPLVILEDAQDTDTSIPDFKDHLSDLESSSMEDLLAIDTRPNSSNRKSVTFKDMIDVEVVPQESTKRSSSPECRSITVKPMLKKEDKQRASMQRLLDYVAERLYKDLLMLVEERDRSLHALELTSDEHGKDVLSAQSTVFQKKYRDKLLENKVALDQRIDQVWSKLKDMPVDGSVAQFVNGVGHSSELTLNMKRRLFGKRESLSVTYGKPRSEVEMAIDFSRRLSHVREQMMRRDSESVEDNRSMQELMCALSRIMSG